MIAGGISLDWRTWWSWPYMAVSRLGRGALQPGGLAGLGKGTDSEVKPTGAQWERACPVSHVWEHGS